MQSQEIAFMTINNKVFILKERYDNTCYIIDENDRIIIDPVYGVFEEDTIKKLMEVSNEVDY